MKQKIEGKMKLKQFGFWENGEDEQYWSLYDTIEDAVSDKGDGCEIYQLEAKRIGKFKRKVEMVKIKPRRKAAK